VTGTTVIGPLDLLDDAPSVVSVEDSRYILSQNGDGDPVLFSAVCPHHGASVGVVDESTLRCPNHRWEFDPRTGDPTRGNAPLEQYDVTITDGELRAPLESKEDRR
jgi:CMP-N-acetylneuraminate monooxygenase